MASVKHSAAQNRRPLSAHVLTPKNILQEHPSIPLANRYLVTAYYRQSNNSKYLVTSVNKTNKNPFLGVTYVGGRGQKDGQKQISTRSKMVRQW